MEFKPFLRFICCVLFLSATCAQAGCPKWLQKLVRLGTARTAAGPAPSAEASAANTAAVEARDLADLKEVHEERLERLGRKDARTRDTVYDLIASGEPVSIDGVLIGAGPAAAKSLLSKDSRTRSRTLVVAGDLSNVYRTPGDKTGGKDTIGETQDNSLFGGATRIFSSVLKRLGFGAGSRGNNEVVGTSTLVHLDGAVNHLLMRSQVVAIEWAAIAKAEGVTAEKPEGKYGDWARKAPVRLKVEMRMGEADLLVFAKKLGISETGFEAIREKVGEKLGKDVKLFMRNGEIILEHWVYTNNVDVAAGLPKPNVYVGKGNNAGKALVENSLEAAGKLKGSGHDALIATADQKKDMVTDPSSKRRGVISGAGDSAFVILQREAELAKGNPEFIRERESAIAANGGRPLSREQEMALLGKYVQPSIVTGPNSTMQARNTLAIFDPTGPYFHSNVFLHTSTRNVEYIDARGHVVHIDPNKPSGEPKTSKELADDLIQFKKSGWRVQVTLEPLTKIESLPDLAKYFGKTPEEFVANGFLPDAYFKGTGRTLADLKPEMVETLLRTVFGKGAQLKTLLEKKYGEGNVEIAPDGSIVVKSDYLGVACGYNGEGLLKGVMGQDGYVPVFQSDSSNEVAPELTQGRPVTIQNRVVGFVKREGGKEKYIALPPEQQHLVRLRGTANNLIRPDQFVAGNSDPGNTPLVGANDAAGHNSSPFGLQNNLPQILFAELLERLHQFRDPAFNHRLGQDGRHGPDLVTAALQGQRKNRPDHQLIPDGKPAEATVALGKEIKPNSDVARYKPPLENDLYEFLLSSYSLKAPPKSGRSYEGVVGLDVENGKLVVKAHGRMGGSGGTFAQKLAEDLARPEAAALRERLAAMVLGLGGDTQLTFRVQDSGLVETGSVRFDSAIGVLAQKAREATRTKGTAGLEDILRENYQGLFGALGNIENFPKAEGGGSNKTLAPVSVANLPAAFRNEVLGHAKRIRLGGAGPRDRIEISNAERTPGGDEYILHISVNGKESGAVIVGAGEQSRLRMTQYLLGAKRVEEAGGAGVRVLDAQRNQPPNDHENFPRLIWYTQYAPGEIPDVSRLTGNTAMLNAFGRSLADFQTDGADRERNIGGNLEARHRNYLDHLQAETLKRTAKLIGPKAAETQGELLSSMRKGISDFISDPFFQGPVVGSTIPGKVSFSKGKNGELQAGFMNYYTARGWGTVLTNIAEFTQDMNPSDKQAVVEAFVMQRLRRMSGGSSPSELEVAKRVAQTLKALPYFEKIAPPKE